MSIETQTRNSWTRRFGARLVVLSLLFGGATACAPVATQPMDLASPTTPVEETLPPVPSGWQTRSASASQGQCAYAISHPPEMVGAIQGTYSWILGASVENPEEAARNFVYVSVIPADFQIGSEENYNYDPAELEILLGMQVGESKSLRDDPSTAQLFTYTRLPDTLIDNQAAMTYENTAPWEFPIGTKEIRHYLQVNDCTYLIGGYMDTTGSSQPGVLTEELFDQIVATFRLMP